MIPVARRLSAAQLLDLFGDVGQAEGLRILTALGLRVFGVERWR